MTLSALDCELEQGVDELAEIVLRPPGQRTARGFLAACSSWSTKEIFNLLSGNDGNGNIECVGKLPKTKAEVFDINVTFARPEFGLNELDHDFAVVFAINPTGCRLM